MTSRRPGGLDSRGVQDVKKETQESRDFYSDGLYYCLLILNVCGDV